jgi:hypothetical protein
MEKTKKNQQILLKQRNIYVLIFVLNILSLNLFEDKRQSNSENM